MLKSETWEQWVKTDRRCLWLHGIPGAGKTILASFLFGNTLKFGEDTDDVVSIYYYCYFAHAQDETIPLLGWVIGQLCRYTQEVPETLLSLHNTGHRPNTQQLMDGLAEILKSLSTVYLVVDALDESKEPRDKLLSMLKALATGPRFNKIQLLLTSREYFDIETVVSRFSASIQMRPDPIQEDIRTYARKVMGTNYRFSNWPEDLRREVQDQLTVGAKGM